MGNKLVEIDFTRFSGSVPIDNVSNTTLSGYVTGSPNIVTVMPGFTFRPGAYFPINGVSDMYSFDVDTEGGEALKMGSNYAPTSKRSFVIWYYCYGPTHDGGSTNYIWGGDTNGWALRTTVGLEYIRGSSQVYATSSGINVGWHNAVVTIDRLSNEYRCYYNGSPVYNDTTMPPTTYDYLDAQIGQPTTDRESDFGLGYVATYDYILSPAEVSTIYLNGLLDEKNPYPFTRLRGVVLDTNDDPLESASVLVYDHVNHVVIDEAISESNGVYTVYFPNPGEFSIYTTKSGTSGGRASSLTVTSGGDIIIYDEE